VLVASIITLVALPFLWASKQSSPSAQDAGVAAIGESGGIQLSAGSSGTVASAGDISFVASEPGYLGGDSARTSPGTIALTVKAAAAGQHLGGAATFHVLKSSGHVCQTSLVPVGTIVHVTDTDNGRSVDCKIVQAGPVPAGTIIVLGPDAFRVLADVVESPIPVELAW
jgi:hypothetical protein